MKCIIALILVGACAYAQDAPKVDPASWVTNFTFLSSQDSQGSTSDRSGSVTNAPSVTPQQCWMIVRLTAAAIGGGIAIYVAYECSHEKPHKPIPVNTPVRLVLKSSGVPHGGTWTPFMTNPPPELPPLYFTPETQEHDIFDVLHAVTRGGSEYYTIVIVDATNYTQLWP